MNYRTHQNAAEETSPTARIIETYTGNRVFGSSRNTGYKDVRLSQRSDRWGPHHGGRSCLSPPCREGRRPSTPPPYGDCVGAMGSGANIREMTVWLPPGQLNCKFYYEVFAIGGHGSGDRKALKRAAFWMTVLHNGLPIEYTYEIFTPWRPRFWPTSHARQLSFERPKAGGPITLRFTNRTRPEDAADKLFFNPVSFVWHRSAW